MADDDLAGRPEDPYVQRMRPDASRLPQRTVQLSGLLGDSARPGYRRLYFTRSLDTYAEFRTDDALNVETVPPEQPPLVGLEATRVTLAREAEIDFTRVHANRPVDEFDLNVRLTGTPSAFVRPSRATGYPQETCPSDCATCRGDCVINTLNNCDTWTCGEGGFTDEKCVPYHSGRFPC